MSNANKLLCLALVAACGDSANNPMPDAPATPPVDAPSPPVDLCGTTQPTQLRTDLAWFGDNRTKLTEWLDSAGCKSATYNKDHKPVALWDWDNTISKNDFGDAITYYFIAHGKVRQPPGQDWHNTSPYLSDAAATALSAACGTTVAAGQALPTDTPAYANCADEILSIYDNETTRAGQPAWKPANARRLEPAFAWTPQLMAGYTHTEVQQFAQQVIATELAAAQDATQTIGTTVENGWLRIYDQQKDLIQAAQTRGYDVWVITASPQDVIGVAAPMVGIPFDHVIGIRSMTDSNGKLTYAFEGCGPEYADNQQDLIPYIQGKRCYVNKVVYGDATPMERRPDGQRQVFASGDSDSDVEFLRDAKYKLVINRNKSDLMCHAYYNEHDTWRINPMFLEPKPARSSPYACATAWIDEHAVVGASRDEGANVISDQTDVAHP